MTVSGKGFKSFFSREMDLTTGNIFGKLFVYSVPIMLTTIFQLFYTTINLVVVSNFAGEEGDTSMSAIGANNALITLLISLFMGFSVGTNVVVANARGSNDKDKVYRSIHSSISLALAMGVFVMIFGVVMSRLFLVRMQTPEEIIGKATNYLMIYFFGMPFLMLFDYSSAILRAYGDSKRPFYALFCGGIVNVLVSLLLVSVFSLDVIGVGIGLISGEAVSSVIVLLFLFKSKHIYMNLTIKGLKFYKDEIKEILKIGVSAGLETFVFSISNVMIQAETNSFGAIAVSGNTASVNLEGYQYNILNSFSVAVTAFVASNIGSLKWNNVQKTIYSAIIIETILGVVVGGILILSRDSLLNLFNLNADEKEVAMQRMMIICTTYFLCGYMDCLSGYLRGMKYAIVSALVSLVGCALLRIVFIFTLFKYVPYFHTLNRLYGTYPISRGVTVLIYLIIAPIYARKTRKKVDEQIALKEEEKVAKAL
jgi:putative MATE family efflux protein